MAKRKGHPIQCKRAGEEAIGHSYANERRNCPTLALASPIWPYSIYLKSLHLSLGYGFDILTIPQKISKNWVGNI